MMQDATYQPLHHAAAGQDRGSVANRMPDRTCRAFVAGHAYPLKNLSISLYREFQKSDTSRIAGTARTPNVIFMAFVESRWGTSKLPSSAVPWPLPSVRVVPPRYVYGLLRTSCGEASSSA